MDGPVLLKRREKSEGNTALAVIAILAVLLGLRGDVMHLARWITLLLLSVMACGQALAQSRYSAYTVQTKPQHAIVQILAMSTSVHLGSGNQEVYLAEVSFKGGPVILAKLADEYSMSDQPILRSVLQDRRELRMTLSRTPECDVTGDRFFLGQEESQIFSESARAALKSHSRVAIPCFNVRHSETRLRK